MTNSESVLVENLLSRPEMHKQWARDYRTDDNERFYEQAFDFIVDTLKPEPGATFLDAGCGSCAHSVRLARRGFKVHAVDFSESALNMAQQFVRGNGVQEQITLGRESLLELSFANESFDYVLCWGVLMHIPEVDRAVAELARVLKPGGALVISEGNKFSLEAVAMRTRKRVLRREKALVKETPAGVEYWKEKDGDALVTRQANIRWLIQELDQCGVSLTTRAPGQLSESYRMFSSSAAKRFFHNLNSVWFRHAQLAAPAFGNLLIFQKRDE